MKRIKTTATVVALLVLSTSAFAGAPGTGSARPGAKPESRTAAPRERTESPEVRKQRAESLRIIRAIDKNLANLPNSTLRTTLTIEERNDIVKKVADAHYRGLFGAQQARLFTEINNNSTNKAYIAVYENMQIMALKNLLDSSNTRWNETITTKDEKGKETTETVEVDAMDFIAGQALTVAKTGSTEFIAFMGQVAVLQKSGVSTREAIKQALSELGISFEEFIKRCMVKK